MRAQQRQRGAALLLARRLAQSSRHARAWSSSSAHGDPAAVASQPTTTTPPPPTTTENKRELCLPRVIGEDAVFENPWLRLKRIRFLDQQGRERQWTGIERTTTYPTPSSHGTVAYDDERNNDKPNTATSTTTTTTTVASLHATATANSTDADKANAISKEEKCDAVVVFPFLTRANAAHQVILIRQFRPPVGKWVVELPAGLMDGDEAPETAAFRELREETGFVGSKVLHMGPPMVNDQGITNGKCRLLLMEVRHEDQCPDDCAQRLEDDEMIQVLLAPLDGLLPWLLARKASVGDALDARLYSYALGLQALPPTLQQ